MLYIRLWVALIRGMRVFPTESIIERLLGDLETQWVVKQAGFFLFGSKLKPFGSKKKKESLYRTYGFRPKRDEVQTIFRLVVRKK
jgi:hypothetical protein